jgi:hypothetical protein
VSLRSTKRLKGLDTVQADDVDRRSGAVSVAIVAMLGGVAVWLLARPAPDAAGAARLRSPEILLAIFDTTWLLLLALPRAPSWPATLTKLAVGAPFHLAIAAAFGAGPGFHAAWAMTACAFAAVGTIGARAAPRVHGLGFSLLAFALPLGAYAMGDFGGADVRAWLVASPTVGPALLARTSTTAAAADAIPALVAAALLLAADLVASRARKEPSA